MSVREVLDIRVSLKGVSSSLGRGHGSSSRAATAHLVRKVTAQGFGRYMVFWGGRRPTGLT